jgi:hypothetical protein
MVGIAFLKVWIRVQLVESVNPIARRHGFDVLLEPGRTLHTAVVSRAEDPGNDLAEFRS